jgi:diadenosine tetraphosphatase ApaH/serine/threonine PP2A family protein phosphatase
VRIALFADIHANAQALDACLAHARDRGVDRLAFLGDFVGYGADAQPVVATIAREVAQGAVAVKGNHDEAVEGSHSYFNEAAKAAIEWARRTLSPGDARFLAGLPLVVREAPICFVHASAASPARWDYIDGAAAAARCLEAAEATYTFCGHVHDQVLYFATAAGRASAFVPTPGMAIPVRSHRRWLAIVGSCGQPRDRNPAAAYALFDGDREEITFHRVAYDAPAAAARIRACGLPESLAFRVELGV